MGEASSVAASSIVDSAPALILSWSTLASAFAPLLTIYAAGRRVSEAGAIVAMAGGVAGALLWRAAELHTMVYEGLPGIVIGLCIAFALSHASEPRPLPVGSYANDA
jgi:SSS family solute:Na+ symporter/sodium/proline symporter